MYFELGKVSYTKSYCEFNYYFHQCFTNDAKICKIIVSQLSRKLY